MYRLDVERTFRAHAMLHALPSTAPRSAMLTLARLIRAAGVSLVASILAACGGGGGGGSSSTGNTGVSSTTTEGAGFPLGVVLHPPTYLISGAPASLADSPVVTAVAQGRQTLDGQLINATGLFDPAHLGRAGCYAPALAYSTHDDQPSAPDGWLNEGDVAMWQTHDGGQPCSAAELEQQLGPLTRQTRQGLLLMALLRQRSVSAGASPLPDPGTTRDLTATVATILAPLLNGIAVQSATVSAASDAALYTYRLVLTRGSGASAESLEVTLRHTPNDTNERFSGVLRLTHSHLSHVAAEGCSDTVDSGTGLYRVAHAASLAYNRYDNALITRLRSAQFCGAPSSGSGDHFGDLVSTTEYGEMDTTVALGPSGLRNGTRGWRRELVRYSADVDLNTGLGDHLHGWQITPQDDRSRLFLAHLDQPGGTIRAQVFHGAGTNLSTSDGVLTGMYCNWSGPGASLAALSIAFQSQTLLLQGGGWQVNQSALAYAPTNSCQASHTMRFDANGDGVLGGTEGNDAASGLDAPTGGRTDVQSEVVERGYWTPTLF